MGSPTGAVRPGSEWLCAASVSACLSSVVEPSQNFQLRTRASLVGPIVAQRLRLLDRRRCDGNNASRAESGELKVERKGRERRMAESPEFDHDADQDAIAWEPGQFYLERSRLLRFARSLGLDSYEALLAWSAGNPGRY